MSVQITISTTMSICTSSIGVPLSSPPNPEPPPRSELNGYPKIITVQADTSSFSQIVHMLTGSSKSTRYQRFNPPDLSNGRKPNVRIGKEDDIENGKLQTYNNHTQVPGSLEGKALRFRSGTSSASQDHNYTQFISDPLQPNENHSLKNFVTDTSGDVLLQWGQNKRSRGSRTENRVVADESSVQARQVIKIPRRVSGSEKQSSASQAQTAAYTRGTNLRPCTPIRETTCSLLNRNLEERPGLGNGSPSGNSGRNLPRGSDKRSLPSPEKTDKPDRSCAEKSNWHAPDPANLESTPSEPEACAAAEKLNLDLFEWPRIYISLSRKEKEDDFLVMKGTKLPQRPKKRAKNVDKTLQYCFPGMFLSDLSRGRYEVREKKCVKKKRRGLKGMESMDSDSE